MARQIAGALKVSGPAMLEGMSQDDIVETWCEQATLFEGQLNLSVFNTNAGASAAGPTATFDAKALHDASTAALKQEATKVKKRGDTAGDPESKRENLMKIVPKMIKALDTSLDRGDHGALEKSFTTVHDALDEDGDA
eukprot:4826893-Amphidinium_carterae.1